MSDLPQSEATGSNSTSSPQRNSTAPNPPLNERWVTALGKLRVMGSMIGWESIRRGMKQEDDARQRWLSANHRLLYGTVQGEDEMGDDMGHLVLGDMIEEHHVHAPAQSTPAWMKAAMAVGLPAAGAAALWLGQAYMKQEPSPPNEPAPPAVVQPDEKPAGQDFDPGGLEIEIVEVPKE